MSSTLLEQVGRARLRSEQPLESGMGGAQLVGMCKRGWPICLFLLAGSSPMYAEELPRSRPHAVEHDLWKSVKLYRQRVEHDFLQFDPSLDPQASPFARERSRERLYLFRPRAEAISSTSLGAGLFAAFALLAAHGPGGLRALFDGPVHCGPAIFDGGGLGAGIGGHWL